ncbi:hypothetical protein F4861DRAFT_544199 [Xylaria intraflava]|nr:hypothetical protein F4861DRAFT_544199 [Xylaria intraflava]
MAPTKSRRVPCCRCLHAMKKWRGESIPPICEDMEKASNKCGRCEKSRKTCGQPVASLAGHAEELARLMKSAKKLTPAIEKKQLDVKKGLQMKKNLANMSVKNARKAQETAAMAKEHAAEARQVRNDDLRNREVAALEGIASQLKDTVEALRKIYHRLGEFSDGSSYSIKNKNKKRKRDAPVEEDSDYEEADYAGLEEDDILNDFLEVVGADEDPKDDDVAADV